MKKFSPLLFLLLCSAFCFAQKAPIQEETPNQSAAQMPSEAPASTNLKKDVQATEVTASTTTDAKVVTGTFLHPGTTVLDERQQKLRDSLRRKTYPVRVPRAF
jgi:hypothetical protein